MQISIDVNRSIKVKICRRKELIDILLHDKRNKSTSHEWAYKLVNMIHFHMQYRPNLRNLQKLF